MTADEKVPALSDTGGKNSDGIPRKRHQKEHKAQSKSQSPSAISRFPVVPESSCGPKMVVAGESEKASASEGERSTGTKEAEAKVIVSATKHDGGQHTVTKDDNSKTKADELKVSRLIPEEKLPALTNMKEKDSEGSPGKRHQKHGKARSGSQSPSTCSRFPLVPESSRESKLVIADEGAKKPVGEGQRSIGTREAEAKETAAATKGGMGQPAATKGDGRQANDVLKWKVSLNVPEADRQRKSCEAPSQSSGYTVVPSRPSLVESPPDDPRGEMFLLPLASGAVVRDLKSDSARRWSFTATDCALVAFAVTCSLAVLWALLFGTSSPRLPQLHTRGLVALERMSGLCNSTDCEAAVREVIGVADPYVDPCEDMHAFACGRWCTFANSTWAPTYWHEQRRRYVSDVEDTLILIYRRALFTGKPFHYMASFYVSCLGLLENRKASLVDCWDAAGVVLEQWTNASDFTTLFALAVHTIVSSGVPSVFKISNYNDATVEVNTGAAIGTTEADDRFRQGQCLHK
ncbi:hypothetical protein HPB51_019245 [Rhipicephalus microplus]|uniref:Uncharacterized protein n=1 Tax=Rhipicephalus microplus TaxID=6941 RepID=A0A9J6F883_RHIMP|nr:hypothetical protein HPB51_019245 [Rhipicephalus microplus]